MQNANMMTLKMALVVFLSAASLSASAAAPTFNYLSQSDFDNVARELSANSALHNVMPASSLGSIFGFEFGLAAGATKTPEINNIVKTASGTEVPMLPHAGLIGALTVPFGLTAEVALIPQVNASGSQYNQMAVALKWTLTELFLSELPLNIAVRGYYSTTKLAFDQVTNNASTSNIPVNTTITYQGKVTGVQVLASPDFIPLIEPYVGFGLLSAKNDVTVSGSASATIFSFTSAQSMASSASSSEILFGANLRLLFFVLGAEYSRAFSVDSYTAKLSFRF